jgi:hypothetical protein
MSNTKTKTGFIESTIATANAKRASDDAAIAAGFEKAEAFAKSLDTATRQHDGFRSELNQGNDCDTLEWKIAEWDVEKYTKLHQNALIDAEALRKRSGSAVLILATALAETLGRIIPVPVHVLPTRASEAPLSVPEDAAPVIFVMPGDSDPDSDYMGALSGDVHIHYHRSALYAPLRVADIEAKTKALGFRVEVRANQPAHGEGVVRDVLKLRVSNFYDGAPVVTRVDTSSNIARQFAENLMGSFGEFPAYETYRKPTIGHEYGFTRPREDGSFTVSGNTGLHINGSPAKWAESIDGDTRVMTSVSTLSIGGHILTTSDVERLSTMYRNQVTPGLGRLVDVSIESTGSAAVGVVGYKISATYESKVA